ncbi:MAG: FkbM family methyltransferase [Thermoplasmata archaeon]|nr:FkbM family methyltransferase [Thermoplasmata archaeon]
MSPTVAPASAGYVPIHVPAPLAHRAEVGRGIVLGYSHPLDLAGILEVYVMDVYSARDLRPGCLVIDLGASIGDFAVLASKLVGPEGKVVAVEPNPTDGAILRENLRNNGCENVAVVAGALSCNSGDVELGFKDARFRSRRLNLEELLAAAGVTLEHALRSEISLKLDIEGAEADSLEALRPLFSAVRQVAIELHGTRAAVDTLLVPAGFEFQRLTRRAYLWRSGGFVVRHPRIALRLWQSYRSSPRFSGLGKIVRGIDIASSTQLLVGVYRRRTTGTGR